MSDTTPSVEDLAAYAREHLATMTPSDPNYQPTLKAVMDLERLSSTLQNEDTDRWVKISDQELKTLDHASHRRVAEKPPIAPTVVSAAAQVGSVGLIVFAERIAVIASKALPMACRFIP
jgi:hypothetical protein|nr:MAG TPA: hypothetical protein [Caudoviricetes sp.]